MPAPTPAPGTALVTGATGLLGSHIVERLLADGWAVRTLVRDPNSLGAAWLGARGVTLVPGDVLDAGAFARAAQGCDVIFHGAAAITPRGGWEAFRRPNIDGTRNAIAAAERTGARLMHVSSVAVYGAETRYRGDGARTSEDTPLAPLPERAFYARSKRESEQMVMEAHAAARIWATAVRPSVIYGPRDRQFVPRVARLLRFGVAPIVGSGNSSLAVVHAANVAEGAVLAATSDAAGGRAYNLADDWPVTVADFFRLAGEGLGRRVRLVRVPLGAARAGLMAVRGVGALLSGGSIGFVTTGSLDFLARDNPFTSERARRELGWRPSVRHTQGVPAAFGDWKATR